ncbi:hypothetical protein [uncultured Jatrophihabitans sp.]|uniref:hypothetical protein n=1 Tax=uncultured Jatrophihabitans sp. TaxID=1610747 RepID=UPI0035C971FF
MPDALAQVLRIVSELERVSHNTAQWHRTIRANSRLMLAAVNAGWQVTEIAAAMGLERHAASKRVQAARREYGSAELVGVDVPQAPPPQRTVKPSPLEILHTPVETRDWLSAPEAMALAVISFGALTAWRKHGLLPNTRWLNPTQALYARGDLELVMAAPRTGRGVDHAAVLEQIAPTN